MNSKFAIRVFSFLKVGGFNSQSSLYFILLHLVLCQPLELGPDRLTQLPGEKIWDVDL